LLILKNGVKSLPDSEEEKEFLTLLFLLSEIERGFAYAAE